MSSSFSFPRLSTTTDDLEDLYKVYGVDRAVVLDLAGAAETPGTVRGGYYGAYLSFFHSSGLTFPILEPVLEILAELRLSFTQVLSNFLRNLIALSVRAREEAPFECYLMSHEICGLIGVLRIGRLDWASFDQARIRAAFAMPEGTNRAPLVGGSEDEAEHSQEVISTHFVRAQSSDRLTRQLVRRSSFRTSGFVSKNRDSGKSTLILIHDSDDEGASEERRSPVSLSPGSGDETVAATRKRRRSSKDTLSGPSRPRFVPEGDGSLFAAQGDLIFLDGRMRSAGCRLPSLASSAEKEAYAKVAVASSKVMEAFNEYVVMMEDHVVASQNDKEIKSIGSEIKRLSGELEAAKREGKKDAEKIEAFTEDWRRIHHENEALTTQVVAQKAKVAALEDKWTSKKKEVSAVIQLQEVTANIDLLNELKDGALTVDAELARLKEMEGDCEDLVASAAVPDWSISELDLPQISEDSVDQVGGSSVPDDSASS
ncbi:hypothetical protein F2Q70_00016423 [Brassica cretica]|uniref:Uncharacterized protein n=1 Tax=Brassica cretica TaxID=69181 RepID=A0A8S9I2S8_BRACR|nr:hypothetical protein F2Q70_00016423 [Brassica cretica]